MRTALGLQKYLLPFLAAAFLGLSGACFYKVNLEPPLNPKVDMAKYQPLALLPLEDAPGHPASGSDLYPILRELLEKKGYGLVSELEVAGTLEEMKLNPLFLLSDIDSLKIFAGRLGARLLLIATLPEYKVQKARVGSKSVELWDGESFTDQMLPTYFGGSSQVRLILRIFESENGELVWRSEGTIRASRESAAFYAEKLAERLLTGLPSIPRPSQK